MNSQPSNHKDLNKSTQGYTVYSTVTALLISAVFLFSCKQPETIVVEDEPVAASRQTDSSGVDSAQATSADFSQLNIGEIDRIPTLDPLFAENTATMRTIQLVFEGLVRYNENSSIVPAAARSWSVGSDSLTYRFSLRTDLFYHDSSVFGTGTGRKLIARDVKFAFQRMAENSVPPRAAKLFMNIKGFEPYYREQHQVFFPPDRRLGGVEGIRVPNDSTVIFNLREPDSRFLNKLATPYAVIYPREALGSNPPGTFSPVGTGPFRFSQRRGDSLYIFGRFDNYHREEIPRLNRIDVATFSNETDLFKSLAREDIHFIPEMGPHTVTGTLDSTGSLKSSYSDQFNIIRSGASLHYALYFNRGSGIAPSSMRHLVRLFRADQPFQGLPGINIEYPYTGRDSLSLGDTTGTAGLLQSVQSTYTREPYFQRFLQHLSVSLDKEGITFKILPLRVPIDDTEIFTGKHFSLFPGDSLNPKNNMAVRWNVPHIGIYRNRVEQLSFNDYAWWIDLRNLVVLESSNL